MLTAAGWRDDGWSASGLRIGARLALASGALAIAAPAGGTMIDVEARAVLTALVNGLRANGLVA